MTDPGRRAKLDNSAAIIDRLLTAAKTGKPITALRVDGLGWLTRHKCWPEAIQAIAEIDAAHPDAQMQFLKSWVRVPLMPYMRGDDDVCFAALRKLLPAYHGPPITLFRGQIRGETVGVSWTRSHQIAQKFALHGTNNVDPHAMHRAGPPRKDAVVLVAENVHSEIICAPCLLGFDEGEFIVDPRIVAYRTLIDYGRTE